MKRSLILSFCLFYCLSFQAFAQKYSSLHLKVFNNMPFTVIMDGMLPQEARDTYTLHNLPSGAHRLQVFQRVTTTNGNSQGVMIANERIEVDNKREYFAYIDHRGNYRIHQIIYQNDYKQNPYLVDTPPPPPANNQPQIQPYPPQQNPTNTSPQSTNPRAGDNTATSSIPANAMNNTDYSNLRQAVKDADFDDTRLTIAKQGIRNYSLSTVQVQGLLDVIGFESSKLDLAKFAYDYTYDRNNYYQLYAAFRFSSSTDELAKYIDNKK